MSATNENEITIDDLQEAAECLVKKIKGFRRSQTVKILGFSITQGGGYYRAVRRYAGKMQTVHIGKHFDRSLAEKKISEFINRV